MKQLLTIRNQVFVPDSPQLDHSSYETREAARGVVLDQAGKVYLLSVYTANYHKLPGGGIDEGESPEEAMKRECLEEIGCHVEIVSELGIITEYRDEFHLIQTSYCYLAKQVGEQGERELEQAEVDEGHDEVKAADIDEAIKILQNDEPSNLVGQFIHKRDLTILEKAKEALE